MDCHICLDKKPHLRSLSCSHEICNKCYLRLDKSACPFCRVGFTYSSDDIKQRAKLGLINGYQSTDVQPGMLLPDEFVFGSSSSLLLGEFYNRENFNMRPRSNSDSIVLSALRFEESEATRSSKKNKKYDYKNDNYPRRKTVEEINERRYLIAKREVKKWDRKEGRLYKTLGCIGGDYEL
jgi:hypothetical protein